MRNKSYKRLVILGLMEVKPRNINMTQDYLNLANQRLQHALAMYESKFKDAHLIFNRRDAYLQRKGEEAYSAECFIKMKFDRTEVKGSLHVIAMQENEGTGSFDTFDVTDLIIKGQLNPENAGDIGGIPNDYKSFDAIHILPFFTMKDMDWRLGGIDLDINTAKWNIGRRAWELQEKKRLTQNYQQRGIEDYIRPVKERSQLISPEIILLSGVDENNKDLNPIFSLSVPNYGVGRFPVLQCFGLYYTYDYDRKNQMHSFLTKNEIPATKFDPKTSDRFK